MVIFVINLLMFSFVLFVLLLKFYGKVNDWLICLMDKVFGCFVFLLFNCFFDCNLKCYIGVVGGFICKSSIIMVFYVGLLGFIYF